MGDEVLIGLIQVEFAGRKIAIGQEDWGRESQRQHTHVLRMYIHARTHAHTNAHTHTLERKRPKFENFSPVAKRRSGSLPD